MGFFDTYNIKIDCFLILNLSKDKILKRLSSGRLIHEKSGRVYHKKYNPPKLKGLDDITKEKLIERKDDNETTILNRFELYKRETDRLVSFFESSKKNINIININADNDIKSLNSIILK